MEQKTTPSTAVDEEARQWEEPHPADAGSDGVGEILEVLRRDAGLDFADYKTSTLRRRIERRLNLRQAAGVGDYLPLLQADGSEREALADDLLIGVTEFFRDPEVFQHLAATVLPELVKERSPRQDLRIWSAGCASGEEAYTLAMLAMGAAADAGFAGAVKVFATDVQQRSLDAAARGVYSAEAVSRLPTALRERWLAPDGEGAWKVVPELRRNVVFARHNLLVDPPFTRMDLVVCRNVLIYLKPAAQLHVLSQLHFALKPLGCLLLGASETVGGLEGSEFAVLERAWRLYRKQGMASPRQSGFPVGGGSGVQLSAREGGAVIDRRLLRDYDVLLKRHMPPGMLIDGERRVLHWFGDLADFLKPPEGRAEEDVLQVVHDALRPALGLALHRAAETGGHAAAAGVPLAVAGRDRLVAISVDCIPDDRSHSAHFHVAFAVAGDAPPAAPAADPGRASLEGELQSIRERLHQTISELQESNERLDLANEELTASNEELQSTNEELKSVNEDLYTLNAELESRNAELAQLNRDYDHLLASSEVATVFLDGELKVRKFGPAIAGFIRLLPQDVGRPIAHIAYPLGSQEELLADLGRVLAEGARIEREIAADGRHFLQRVLPFRDDSGRQDGAVLTFTDVTALRTAERQRTHLKSILDALPDGVYIVNAAHEIEYINPVLEREFGPVDGKKCHEYFHGLPAACGWCRHAEVTSGQPLRWEWTSPRGRTYDVFDLPFRNPDGSVSQLELFHDVTDRRRNEDRLRLAARVFEESGEAIMITDAEERIVEVNRACCDITGYGPEELVGQRPTVLASGRHEPEYFQRMKRALAKDGYWHGELWNRRRNGEVYPAWMGISAVRDGEGQVSNYLGIFSDITERKASQARIEYMAHHDALTGLPNRLLFRERFDLAHAYAQRNGGKVALLCVDVDRFKAINDSLGHGTGDHLLRAVAQRLRECLRDTDTLSRQGGDEFLVVLGALNDIEAASQVAEKMLDAAARPFLVDRQEITISFSLGVAVAPDDGGDFETLLKLADTAMYHAKDAGRNTFRFFDARMNVDAVERLQTANGLRHALARSEFRLHYQPQVDIASGRVIGAEALIRWQHPDLGLVSPAQFIPVAEDSGLIVPIGEWVLNEACRQAAAWQAAGGPEITMAVNLSAIQFRRGDIEQTVMGALAVSGLEPHCLELELTESLLVSDTEHVLATVHRLKALGIKLSIDDFGTGYSSLAYLKRFAVDRLKIDQSFIRDMATDPDAASIVRAIIQMARSLNLRTVSEGVENERLLEYLRVLHCDEAQGYHFARPMPAEEFSEWIAGRIGAPAS